MTADTGDHAESGTLTVLTRLYARTLVTGLALLPSCAIVYLYRFQQPGLIFENHRFHELAIGFSILIGGFVSYVTWRCYRHSGEIFLRWLTLGFLAFTVVYAPHGIFTSTAHENMWLFILYGPVSRLLMAACFFIGLLQFGRPAMNADDREGFLFWLKWVLGFVLVDGAVAWLAYSPYAGVPAVRLALELGAALLMFLALVTMIRRHVRSPLMKIYAISLAGFAQSSLAFTLSLPWSHLWWLAHVIFAGGFFLLSYGIVQAFHGTRSFSRVYSQVELMEQLQHANRELERLAATDSLTGAANRREFLSRAQIESARAIREHAPLSVLALDLDHFKAVNDQYGHQAGDLVLQAFVRSVKQTLRPNDLIGRMGGEEFLVLLPDTDMIAATTAAQRVRLAIENQEIAAGGNLLRITVSIGVAQFGVDGDSAKACFAIADGRLYSAKQAGRNRVVNH